jgi:hypothetical protein
MVSGPGLHATSGDTRAVGIATEGGWDRPDLRRISRWSSSVIGNHEVSPTRPGLRRADGWRRINPATSAGRHHREGPGTARVTRVLTAPLTSLVPRQSGLFTRQHWGQRAAVPPSRKRVAAATASSRSAPGSVSMTSMAIASAGPPVSAAIMAAPLGSISAYLFPVGAVGAGP